MTQLSPNTREIARRLLEQETKGRRDPEELEIASNRACAELHRELVNLVGPGGGPRSHREGPAPGEVGLSRFWARLRPWRIRVAVSRAYTNPYKGWIGPRQTRAWSPCSPT